MLPTRAEALKLLEEGYLRNPGQWKDHSIVTAECAYKIAEQCAGMYPEKAYILGLLHDIGRREGVTYIAHVIDGYRYLTELGYDEAARVCITHSFARQNINDYIGKIDITADAVEELQQLLTTYDYDDYDLLIQLCDSIALPSGSVPIEERIADVKKRYGSYPEEKRNKTLELKQYFEEKSGLDIDHLNIIKPYT
ncbi:MAG: HD domain-containing protein [Treponema sp.]